MSDSKNILYIGVEFTEEDTLRSKIMTDDPFVVLADMLLKARKPYGVKPNRTKKVRHSASRVLMGSLEIPNPNYIDMAMITTLLETHEKVSTYKIDTRITDKVFPNKHKSPVNELQQKENFYIQFGTKTSLFYKGPSYELSLRELVLRLMKFTCNDITLAKVLCVYAASSPEHPIWTSYPYGSKGLGAGYKSRWNLTNWSGWS